MLSAQVRIALFVFTFKVITLYHKNLWRWKQNRIKTRIWKLGPFIEKIRSTFWTIIILFIKNKLRSEVFQPRSKTVRVVIVRALVSKFLWAPTTDEFLDRVQPCIYFSNTPTNIFMAYTRMRMALLVPHHHVHARHLRFLQYPLAILFFLFLFFQILVCLVLLFLFLFFFVPFLDVFPLDVFPLVILPLLKIFVPVHF